jgi:3-deoxy-manno-octulosonate cytidylyltransferase (CMP-KDO synthetase)
MSKFLILVPARFGSSRFPGKPLAKINNNPMIQYVVQNCKDTGFDYSIVTDNDEIENFVNSIEGNVVRVDDDVSTGSERIALAYKRFFNDKDYEFIINVQGDEPLLVANEIKMIGLAHQSSDFDIFTAVKKRKSHEPEFRNNNVVKCIYSEVTNQCLYFSRESIPFNRDGVDHDWYQHIGIYSYKVKALLNFVELNESSFEKGEKLEQLRALENGMSLGAELTEINLIGVDTPEDIHKIEGVLRD